MSTSSFISEHTAEYILVPRICRAIQDYEYRCIPFYFWATREGATKSQLSGAGVNVRLIAVYPRRPKVENPGQEMIDVKFNYSLFQSAIASKNYDIPVIAGVPLASSFTQLSIDTNCTWFYLNPDFTPVDDIIISISVNDHTINRLLGPELEIIQENQLFHYLINKTAPIEWNRCIEIIHELRFIAQDTNYHNPFMQWFGMYKPFYIALIEKSI